MYDRETGNLEYVEYEKYQETLDNLENAKKIIDSHQELISDLIITLTDKLQELKDILNDTKKDLTQLTKD